MLVCRGSALKEERRGKKSAQHLHTTQQSTRRRSYAAIKRESPAIPRQHSRVHSASHNHAARRTAEQKCSTRCPQHVHLLREKHYL
jgi:hypothetical protein